MRTPLVSFQVTSSLWTFDNFPENNLSAFHSLKSHATIFVHSWFLRIYILFSGVSAEENAKFFCTACVILDIDFCSTLKLIICLRMYVASTAVCLLSTGPSTAAVIAVAPAASSDRNTKHPPGSSAALLIFYKDNSKGGLVVTPQYFLVLGKRPWHVTDPAHRRWGNNSEMWKQLLHLFCSTATSYRELFTFIVTQVYRVTWVSWGGLSSWS